MIVIETIRQTLDEGYTLSVSCPKCQIPGPVLNLRRLIAQGHGDRRAIDLGLRHDACGEVLQLTLHPPAREVGSKVPWS